MKPSPLPYTTDGLHIWDSKDWIAKGNPMIPNCQENMRDLTQAANIRPLLIWCIKLAIKRSDDRQFLDRMELDQLRDILKDAQG